MMEYLNRLLGRERRSAEQAKERLQVVLIHDRTDLSPSVLEAMRDELVGVISRHVDIDPSSVKLEMTQEGREQRLIADIPLPTSRRRGML